MRTAKEDQEEEGQQFLNLYLFQVRAGQCTNIFYAIDFVHQQPATVCEVQLSTIVQLWSSPQILESSRGGLIAREPS